MADSQHITTPVIEAVHLRYRYADGTSALDNVNFHVAAGDRLAIIGPNGAGKSTLLLCLMGLLPAAGEIRVQGELLDSRNARRLRRHMALVFQDPDDQLFMPTLREDVAFGPLNLDLSPPEVERRVDSALRRLQLEDQQNRAPHHLSFGEKRRAALATALAMEADILLLDEPTSNLDPATRFELANYLQNIPATLIFASHDLDLARNLGTKCLLLSGGKPVKFGAAAEILNNPELLRRHRLAP